MPLQRVSQGFKDISMTFQRNPLTNDLIALKNISAITRSVRNIIFTHPGEKPFDPEFGSQVSRMLFENADPINSIRMKREIEYCINRYEPRVLLTSVVVTPNYDSNSFDIGINYNIIGIDVPTQNLEFVLQSTSQ
jgi:phage baseplate assembly protein W